MFKRSTVFVVGAGASADLGFPLGDGLRDGIVNMLKKVHEHGNDQQTIQLRIAFQDHGRLNGGNADPSAYIRAAGEIAGNLGVMRSIDDFVNHHEGDRHIEFVAKAAITLAIASSEKSSSLMRSDHRSTGLNIERLKANDVWLLPLWQLLTESTTVRNLKDAFCNVVFLVFNYDRVLEAFLVESIKGLYRKTHDEAVTFVEALPIIHPYGMIALLGNSSDTMPYGGTHEMHGLDRFAENVKTYGETERDKDVMNKLYQWFSDAQQIIFIGFGFHRQNMDFLKRANFQSQSVVYSTAPNLDSDVTDNFKNAVASNMNINEGLMYFRNMKGAQLLRTFGPRLTQ